MRPPQPSFQAKCRSLLTRLRGSSQGLTLVQLARVLGGCSVRTIFRILKELEAQGCRFTRESGPDRTVRIRLAHDARGRRQVPRPAARLFLALYRAALGLDALPEPGHPAAFLEEPAALLEGALGLAGAPAPPAGCVIQGMPAVPVGQLPWHLLEPLADALEDQGAVRVERHDGTFRLVPHQLRFGPGCGAGVLLAWDPALDDWLRLDLLTLIEVAPDGRGCVPRPALHQLDHDQA